MADTLGLIGSQDGYNVDSAADFHLAFSSNWPLLKIAAQGTFSFADRTLDQDIYTHNLNYHPVFWIFETGAYGDYSSGQVRPEIFGSGAVTTTKLRWMGSFNGEPAGAVSGYYYVFRYDMTTAYTAETIVTTAATQGAQTEFGIDIAKPNKDVSSTDLRDFVIHHKTRSPQIHKSGTVTGTTNTIDHNLGYIPLYDVYRQFTDAGTTYYRRVTNSQDMTVSVSTTQLTFGAGSSLTFAYVIYKDPFEID